MTKYEQVLAAAEANRRHMMKECEELVTLMNKCGFYGSARRFQHALITLQNVGNVEHMPMLNKSPDLT